MAEPQQPFDDLPEDALMALLLELFEFDGAVFAFDPAEWGSERALLNRLYRQGQEHERHKQARRAR